MLCGNKIDLQREVSTEEGKKLAEKEKMLFFEVSAKSGTNVNRMMYTSIAQLPFFYQFHIEDNQEDIERVKDHVNGTRIYRLGRSLQIMAEADLVIFAGDTIKNCENAKGYKAELAICEIYDKPKLSEHELSEYIRDARWLKRRIKECHTNIQKLKEPTDCIFGGPVEEIVDNGDGTKTVIKR